MLAGNGHMELAELIKDQCKDEGIFKKLINGLNEQRNTPLHWATLNNQMSFVKFLIENGSDTSIKNSDAQTSLDLAIGNGNEEIMVGFIRKCWRK